jgi:hypothetical protein
MQVLVRDNNVDPVLKVLKKKMQREGLLPMKARVVPGAQGEAVPHEVRALTWSAKKRRIFLLR